MMASFVSSWPLFADTYLTAWAMAALLGLVGVPVVARDQIFVGAAVAQSAMLGLGIVLWLGYLPLAARWPAAALPLLLTVVPVALAVGTTLLTTRPSRAGQTAEGRTGWVFLAAGSLTIVLLASSPVGLNEVQQRLASSIVGATRRDTWTTGLLLLAAAAACWRWHRPLTLLVTDPAMAAAVGLRPARGELLLGAGLGIVVGLCLPPGGLLYCFGCLVLPGLAARHACREVRRMYLVAPLLALASAIAGFLVGHAADLPQAPLTVALLAAWLPVARLWQRLRQRHRGEP
jgi:ABC-type Mn2+/Zn2+ transport system permease subunit